MLHIYSTGANQILNLISNILSGRDFRRETPLSTPMVDSSRARILKYQDRGELTKLNSRVNSLSGNLSEKIKLSNYRLYMLLVSLPRGFHVEREYPLLHFQTLSLDATPALLCNRNIDRLLLISGGL